MVKVLQQNRSHPLFGLLSQTFDMQRDITDTVVRAKPKTRSGMPRSVLNELGRHLFAHCVELWYGMAEESRQWYRDNAPPQFCTGFLWWTWSCLVKNYNAGPWTVNVSTVGGHCYICPKDAPEGIFAKGYVDTTEIGTLAHLDWDPACREEELPLLLVHGWYPGAFDPGGAWRVMAHTLTGKDPAQAADFAYIYDPDRPGDENYAVKFLTGQGLDVYISNYTHDPGNGTPVDIRCYAHSLAHEIEIVRSHKGAPAVDILSHSMGGIVARAYIENEDLMPGPYEAPYRGDVFNLIMLAPPNQGAEWGHLYPGQSDWTSVLQLEAGSDFLTQLNSGIVGRSKGVTYHIIAGNKYDCEQWILGPCSGGSALCIMWHGELVMPNFVTYPQCAYRLCEVTNEEPNDGQVTVKQTRLTSQNGVMQVSPDNFHVRSFDHLDMLGKWDTPCDSATLVKIILAGYSLAKWRAKGKDIDPPDANYLQRCFGLIERTDACREIYDHIVDANITVEFRDLPTGTIAQWIPDDNTIAVDISAEALDEKVTSQYIIHEAELSRWHGEDSISGEYHAFKAEADFWNAVKKGDQDDHCDWVAGFIAQGREAAMDYIRALPAYDGWPEYSGVSDDLTEAFRALEDRPTGYPVCLIAQRMGVQLEYNNNIRALYGYLWLVSQYPFAHYDWEAREGALDQSWQALPLEATVAALAYLVKSAAQNAPPSIDREYNAFVFMARIWKAIKGVLEHDFCDEVDFYMYFSKAVASEWIRTRYEYADFPKEYISHPTPADGKLHVYFLDVGEGDAIFIVTPQGKTILIDGGESPSTLLAHVGRRLAPWDRRISAVILTHADEDHVAGQIPVLDRYYVAKVFDSGYPHTNPQYAQWMGLVSDKRIPYTLGRSGAYIDTGDGVQLTILHPGSALMQGTGADANNNSIVIRLVMGDVSFLLTGDIEEEAEQALLDSGHVLQSTVLKVPHHGGASSSTQAFLEAVNPQIAVISVGADNPFGHPTDEIIERLEAVVGSDHIYRTDYNGTIEITVEGTTCPATFHPITVVPPPPEEGEPPEEPGEKININTASQAELETLEAIGPIRAQGIIQYRPYESIEEIQRVPGIGPLTFMKIQDFITVG